MEFRILGPLEVLAAGRAVAVPGAKPRAVLAVLLVHANRPVSAEQLAVALWGEEARAGATNTVQVHVSRLRKALGNTDELETTPAGYRLRVEVDQLDAARFEQLLAEGRAALETGRAGDAAAQLAEALALWRGRALDDLAYEPFAQREIARLEEARMAAYELLFEAKLALGRHAEVVAELEPLIAAHPYRERLRAQLMLALYRCDRQADALQAYQDARAALVDGLGIEPGERLRELERAILAQDAALVAPAVETSRPAETAGVVPAGDAVAPPASRRLVTVLFAGAAGLAGELDAESMHGVLDAYSAVIERHGGTVEGFSGDALVGVFGKATVHEDDSMRAVRAAVELRAHGGMRLGVEAGEVFVGAFATGEAFTVAARLERAAPDGAILLGEHVHQLVRDTVRTEPFDGAWRLVALEDGAARAPVSPFVDRHDELDALRGEFARVRDEPACRAVTVVGPAGIGKSRLARELVSALGDDATVLVGRCPSYGEGRTYRPLAEMVAQLAGPDPHDRISALLDRDETLTRIVLGAIGLSDTPAQTQETFGAVRQLCERLAAARPLVVIVEDIHWAEPTLVDLLDYVIAFASARSLLLVCLARPDLLEARPAWAAPQPNRSLLVLDPLPDGDAGRLVASAGELAEPVAQRIVALAEGNPLFLEQLAAVGTETGETALPSTIHAVLAARIGRLDPAERALLEEASVQGRSFYVGALGEAADAAPRLVALVHKQLVRADRSDLPGQDAFRFAHALIREAAYRGLPKQRRADLHEHVARWTEAWPGAEDETIGHHLGEAYRYRAELGPAGEPEHALAGEAAERFAAAADAALVRGDPAAGARLLERAAALLDWYPAARGEVLPALGAALFETGRIADAARVLDEAIAAAPEPRLRARAQVERELVRLEAEPSSAGDLSRQVTDSALPVLERDADEYGLCRLHFLRGRIDWDAGQVAAAEDAWGHAAELASRVGAQRDLFELVGWRALAAAIGPTPVDDAIARCEGFAELVHTSPLATASTLKARALLHAMRGDHATADRLLAEAGEVLSELRGLTAGVSHLDAQARLVAGEPERAEALLRTDAEIFGEGSTLATTTAFLAQAVYAQGRFDEAEALCRDAERLAAPDDMLTQVVWRGVAARALAQSGRGDEAEALARAALALVEGTDLLWHHGAAMLDLAEVLRLSGRTEAAERATRAGHALYERKGYAVGDERGGR